MIWLLVENDVDVLYVAIEHVVGISFISDIDYIWMIVEHQLIMNKKKY